MRRSLCCGPMRWLQRPSGALVMWAAFAVALCTPLCSTASAVSLAPPVSGSPRGPADSGSARLQEGSKDELAWHAAKTDDEDVFHNDVKEHLGQIDELVNHMSQFQACQPCSVFGPH